MPYTIIPPGGGGSVTLASLSGLTAKQVVIGAADGSATQSADFTYDDSTNDLSVSASESGGVVAIAVANTSNTASSAAQYTATVAGSSAGNPFSTYTISGGQSYSIGIDNSTTGDPLVISAGATVPDAASALGLVLSASGEVGINMVPQASVQLHVKGPGTTNGQGIFRVSNNGTQPFAISAYSTAATGSNSYGEARAGLVEFTTTSLTKMFFMTGATIPQFGLVNGSPGLTVFPTGVNRCWVGGTIKTIQSDTGNVGAGEDTLHTYTLPAAMLNADGQSIEVETVVTFAANANSKQVKVFFGATAVYASGAQLQSGGSLVVRARIVRSGATTQRALAVAVNDAGTPLFADTATYTEPGETLSGTVVIKVTGEGVSDNDIVNKVTRIEWAPALN